MQLRARYPNNGEAVIQLRRVKRHLEEQRNGIYNFKDIHQHAQNLRPPHLDNASFLESVIVKPSEGRGRGLFTTKAVKAGDLVLCEKAFAHCYAKPEGQSGAEGSDIGMLFNLQTDRMTTGTQIDLITEVVQKLRRNPSFLQEFSALHHGTYSPVCTGEVDGKPVVDT